MVMKCLLAGALFYEIQAYLSRDAAKFLILHLPGITIKLRKIIVYKAKKSYCLSSDNLLYWSRIFSSTAYNSLLIIA